MSLRLASVSASHRSLAAASIKQCSNSTTSATNAIACIQSQQQQQQPLSQHARLLHSTLQCASSLQLAPIRSNQPMHTHMNNSQSSFQHQQQQRSIQPLLTFTRHLSTTTPSPPSTTPPQDDKPPTVAASLAAAALNPDAKGNSIKPAKLDKYMKFFEDPAATAAAASKQAKKQQKQNAAAASDEPVKSKAELKAERKAAKKQFDPNYGAKQKTKVSSQKRDKDGGLDKNDKNWLLVERLLAKRSPGDEFDIRSAEQRAADWHFQHVVYRSFLMHQNRRMAYLDIRKLARRWEALHALPYSFRLAALQEDKTLLPYHWKNPVDAWGDSVVWTNKQAIPAGERPLLAPNEKALWRKIDKEEQPWLYGPDRIVKEDLDPQVKYKVQEFMEEGDDIKMFKSKAEVASFIQAKKAGEPTKFDLKQQKLQKRKEFLEQLKQEQSDKEGKPAPKSDATEAKEEKQK